MTPSRPLHGCRWPGCPTLLRSGRFCPPHQAAYDASRGTPAERGYDQRHAAWRLQVLARDQLCVDPDRRHPTAAEPARVADHIVPLRAWERDRHAAADRLAEILRERGREPGPWALTARYELTPWGLENGQGLCVPCHNAKSAREAR